MAIMIIAILYGGYELFFRSSGPDPQESTQNRIEGARDFASTLTMEMEGLDLNATELLILDAVSFDPGRELFYDWPHGEEPQKDQSVETPEFMDVNLVYDGYIEMNSARLAVINGHDYAIGEIVPEAGVRVVGIYPHEVVLEFESDSRRISIYYEEEL